MGQLGFGYGGHTDRGGAPGVETLDFSWSFVDRTGHSQVDIIISDTGCGMTEAFQKHMFEPFTQDSLKRPASQTDGSGLGLAIVKRIIELHGGRVSAQSEPGRGAVFSIWLAQSPERGKEQL